MTATISHNLKRLRNTQKLTQEQAAEALGVSAQTVSRWECASSLPDVTLLPQIARLYCVTVDDLFKEVATPYTNYASRLGSIFEASLAPEDFLRADAEYRRLLDAGEESAEDLRLYGILYQHMMHVCIRKAGELFDRVLSLGPERSGDTYWAVRRQKGYFLWEIGRNRQNIEEFLPAVAAGSDELQEWICLIQAYSFDEDLENAWKWAQKAAEKFPESALLHIYIGDLLRDMKRYDEAFPHWQRALELEPEWCDAAYSMGSCWEELGEFEKACRVYEQLVRDLKARGFEAELTYPRSLAQKCREKLSPGE